jgi:hypothetical protein
VEKYWKGVMYAEGEKKFGVDIQQKERMRWDLKAVDPSQAKVWLKQHPELKQYWSFKDGYRDIIEQQIIELGLKLPDIKPAQMRGDEFSGLIQEEIARNALGIVPAQLSPEQLVAALGSATYNQVIDYIIDGDPLDTYADNRVEDVAGRSGVSEERIFELVSRAIGVN